MSTSIDTIRVGSEREDRTPDVSGGVVDVTEVPLRDLESVIGDDRNRVHLERHSGRTYVVTDH
jgi:hypothetical protein